jgi:hypothetical protein
VHAHVGREARVRHEPVAADLAQRRLEQVVETGLVVREEDLRNKYLKGPWRKLIFYRVIRFALGFLALRFSNSACLGTKLQVNY